MEKTKPFTINKHLVLQAYKLVKAHAGASGIDRQTLSDFDKNLKNNLYKIWNRFSSGSYYPPAVKAVSILKKDGGQRILGVPTVSDRIAQMVVKLVFEPEVEPHFYQDSYGYRPKKSALDAVGITRTRCWKYNFVLEFDIKGLFDNIDHELIMKAVRKHTDNKWVILYIERWLKAPMQMPDGTLVARTKGTPQGGVISPILSNLFLHYVFDAWISRNHPMALWCRYADDGLIHCRNELEAKQMLTALTQRFASCKLALHPEKTKIVYCKDANRKDNHANTSFEFLGYCFRRRVSKNSKSNKLFMNFTPGVSNTAIKSMRLETRKSGIRNKAAIKLQDIAKLYNPVLRGWIAYYGKYNKWALAPVFRHFNTSLIAWARKKFKTLQSSKRKVVSFMKNISKIQPKLFAHWEIGMVDMFA
ncbi:group II intron reverse transcriptase/maturase [Cardinium endosymbiont of Philonthus spinipes]|uniref:group II intron reverse transcriptase/maturase n=1 Tax=Cardinium endosymbiont of Philonthus spinipes TaxID=3077941 RepID=UPI00313AA9B7